MKTNGKTLLSRSRALSPAVPAGALQDSLAAPGLTPLFQTPEPSSQAIGLNIKTVLEVQNHWREFYNPLRALDLQRYIALYDFSRRGLNAELQNVYREMEQLFPTLIGLMSRTTSQLLKRELIVRTVDEKALPPGFTKAQADLQADCLRTSYAGLKNKRDIVRKLHLGKYRGWSHLEKIYANPGTSDWTVESLEFVEQWHFTRKSMYAKWEYIPAATQSNCGIPINEDQFVIYEAPFALDRLALLLWIRANLAEKDWDAFVELYGIPRWIVIMPANVPKEKEAEYMQAAKSIASGASGALPGGSDAKVSDGKQEGAIFRQRLDWIQEQLVLAGTGGMLSMLSKPTGIGQGATTEHADAFDEVGDMDAAELTECLQQQYDRPILAREFPGQPVLAGVVLAAPAETDTGAVCAEIMNLSSAGYLVEPAQVTEKTGYRVTIKVAPPPTPDKSGENEATVQNRGLGSISDEFQTAAKKQLAASIADDLSHAAAQLAAALDIQDADLRAKKLRELLAKWPGITADTLLAPRSSETLANIIATAYADGLQATQGITTNRGSKVLNDGSPDQPRDERGRFAEQSRGESAMDSVLSEKRDAASAMKHPDFGDVDFRYGDNKSGIAHVVEQHGEDTARKIPAVIAHGKVTKGPTRAFVEHRGNKVVLSNNWHGQPSNHWVVSAYEKGGNR
jgi:hypothetical protein